MIRDGKKLRSFHLAMIFSVIIFFIMLLSMALIALLFIVMIRMGFFEEYTAKNPILPILLFAIISLLTGTVIAAIVSRIPLFPICEIIRATDKLASGDFSARVSLKGPKEIRDLGKSFNHMAEELGGTEMLRSDFVSNFSHEFKTPIVSIQGFAKMLKYNDLSPEEHEEYLDIIITESKRLSELATNVLNLSKIENQVILSEKKRYNVTEQIRCVIAVLEPKWSRKNLSFRFECDEIHIYANEELLSQVWMNLIDNAVKFSPSDSEIDIRILKKDGKCSVIIADRGTGMTAVAAKRIFDKFYQGDTSRAVKGNGLGLTIAKKITELHGGYICLDETGSEGSVFRVTLPSE